MMGNEGHISPMAGMQVTFFFTNGDGDGDGGGGDGDGDDDSGDGYGDGGHTTMLTRAKQK